MFDFEIKLQLIYLPEIVIQTDFSTAILGICSYMSLIFHNYFYANN